MANVNWKLTKATFNNINWENVDSKTITYLESLNTSQRNAILGYANSQDDTKSLNVSGLPKTPKLIDIINDLEDISDPWEDPSIQKKNNVIDMKKANQYANLSEYMANITKPESKEQAEVKAIVDAAPMTDRVMDATAIEAQDVRVIAAESKIPPDDAQPMPVDNLPVSEPESVVEQVTATNVEKDKAIEIARQRTIVEKAETGTEYRNEAKQREVLGLTIHDLIQKHTLGQDIDGNYFKHYYASFKHIDVTNMVGFRKAHMFMTAPNCNIFKKDAIRDFFNPETGGIVQKTRTQWMECLTDDIRKHPDLCNAIVNGNIDVAIYLDGTTRFNGRRNVWNYPLMNMARNFSGLPNFDLKTRQGPMNFLNNYTEMVVNSAESISGNTINISFLDDKDSVASRMLYIWTLYAEAVGSGLVSGRNSNNREIDYMSTIYLFVTDESNTKLKYWFSFIGCFPKSRSYDHLSITLPSIKDKSTVNVPFKLTVPVDMHPSILAMFNQISAMQDSEDFNESGSQNLESQYNYASGNPSGVSGKLRNENANIGTFFSDMFFISSKRPIFNKKTGLYAFSSDSEDIMTDSKGRISYYLMMSNRTNKMIPIVENGRDGMAKLNTNDPAVDKFATKRVIQNIISGADGDSPVVRIEGPDTNINRQIIEDKRYPSGSIVSPDDGISSQYQTFYDRTRDYRYRLI